MKMEKLSIRISKILKYFNYQFLINRILTFFQTVIIVGFEKLTLNNKRYQRNPERLMDFYKIFFVKHAGCELG